MKRHIPNLLTSLNVVVGTAGIYYVLTIDRESAFYFVILAAFFDFFDGFTARLLKVKSDFGKELDSLADHPAEDPFCVVPWAQPVADLQIRP